MKLTKKILEKIILEELEKQKEKKGAKELYDAIMALLLAAVDDEKMEEGRRFRGDKRRKKMKKDAIKRAKERANIPLDLNIRDFTDEQKQLYDDAKKQLKKEDEAQVDMLLNNLLYGDLLELPVVNQLAQRNPVIAAFIKSAAADGQKLSLTNLINKWGQQFVTGE